MSYVTMRDLRNHGGDVIDRVVRGERVTVTRAGKPVAELRPIVESKVTGAALLDRWRHLPVVDSAAFRADLDELLDPSV